MTILILAAIWCAAYGLLSLSWAFGAPGFPFGAGDSRGHEMGSLLASAHPVPTGSALAVGCAIAVFAAVCAWRRPGRAPR